MVEPYDSTYQGGIGEGFEFCVAAHFKVDITASKGSHTTQYLFFMTAQLSFTRAIKYLSWCRYTSFSISTISWPKIIFNLDLLHRMVEINFPTLGVCRYRSLLFTYTNHCAQLTAEGEYNYNLDILQVASDVSYPKHDAVFHTFSRTLKSKLLTLQVKNEVFYSDSHCRNTRNMTPP